MFPLFFARFRKCIIFIDFYVLVFVQSIDVQLVDLLNSHDLNTSASENSNLVNDTQIVDID
jgi:hypothetical protein